jgi:hypothetical protein
MAGKACSGLIRENEGSALTVVACNNGLSLVLGEVFGMNRVSIKGFDCAKHTE